MISVLLSFTQMYCWFVKGRMIKKWLDGIDFRTKSGCRMPLSKVYVALQNPFYYGEFQYGDKWYKGTHKLLISKSLFEKVQIQLQVAPKQWNKQLFPFKKICKCGSCGGSVTAEIKYRRTKANEVHTHIYYHCNRIKKYDCKEPYIAEEELIKQLIGYLPQMKLNTKYLMAEFETEVKRLQHLKATVIDKFTPRFELTQHNTGTESTDEASSSQTEIIKEYLLHVLQYGTPEERLKILGGVKSQFILKDGQLKLI